MDFAHVLRRLVRSPGFLTAACLSLALGIGANTAAFSLVHAVLLRSLPVEDPASLAVVSAGSTAFQYSMSYPAYTYLRDHASMVDGLIAFRAQPLNVSVGTATERVSGMLVSGNYFDVLGVTMRAGSSIRAEDDEVAGAGGARGLVAVVSYDYWRRRLKSDAAVVGSTIRINGQPLTIVGIAPEGFRGTRVGSLPDVFVPMMFAPWVFNDVNWLTNPQNNWLRLLARVRREATVAQAQTAMTAALRQFNTDVVLPLVPSDRVQSVRARTIRLEPGHTGLLELNLKPTLFALLGLVGLVLLMACVNVASLMVARAERLHRQTAISIALGATRARVCGQSVIEGLVVGAGGVAFGLVIAVWMRGLLLQLVPRGQEVDLTMDMRVFGMSVGIGLLTTVALAFVTARHTMRVGVVDALKGTDLSARLWLRKGLIVVQLALSVLVLAAASLFTRTLDSLLSVDPGFDREHVLIASTSTEGYSREQRDAFYARVLQDVRAIPGVVAAALASDEPLRARTGWTVSPPGTPSPQLNVSVQFVSPDYFKTMGVPMLRGREFDERDRPGALAVIVNERFARRYLPPGAESVGASFVGNGNTVFEVVGVVGNSASTGLRDFDQDVIYMPGGRGVLHVRSAVPPATLIGSVRAAVQQADPQVPLFDVRTIGEQIDLAIGRERMFATLSQTFGVLALVLASVGLFSVMANAVARRRKELGVRLAIGATPSLLIRSVFGEAAVLLGLGLTLGLPAAGLVARSVRGLLFGIASSDWQSLAVPVAVLAVVAAGAVWVPARRASRADPLEALRSE